MASTNAKKLLAPEAYLQKHCLMTYVQDAVGFVLQRKDYAEPLDVLVEYFASVKSGTHIAFREYSYVAATPYNRAAFLKLFWRTYALIALKGHAMNIRDYLSLLRLLCPDFPEELVHRLPQCVKGDVLSFSDFIYAFQVIFCYHQFLSRCLHLHVAIQDGGTPGEGSATWLHGPTCNAPATLDTDWSMAAVQHTVDATTFGEAVVDLASSHLINGEPGRCCPSVQTLVAVFDGCQSLSFDQFVLKLCTSDCVSNEIGVLPRKADFLSTCVALQHTIA